MRRPLQGAPRTSPALSAIARSSRLPARGVPALPRVSSSGGGACWAASAGRVGRLDRAVAEGDHLGHAWRRAMTPDHVAALLCRSYRRLPWRFLLFVRRARPFGGAPGCSCGGSRRPRSRKLRWRSSVLVLLAVVDGITPRAHLPSMLVDVAVGEGLRPSCTRRTWRSRWTATRIATSHSCAAQAVDPTSWAVRVLGPVRRPTSATRAGCGTACTSAMKLVPVRGLAGACRNPSTATPFVFRCPSSVQVAVQDRRRGASVCRRSCTRAGRSHDFACRPGPRN